MIAGTETLVDRIADLVSSAGTGRTLASVTVEVDLDDPVASVFASRRAGDRWFAWEQPDSDGFALAGLGSAHEAISRGPNRFADLGREVAAIHRGRASEEPDDAPAGSGPVWTGGFAFDPDGARAPEWSSFPPALLVLPELSLLRRGGRTWLTLSTHAGGEDGEQALEGLAGRVAALGTTSLPLLDPSPTGATEIRSVRAPSGYEEIVERAVGTIRAGAIEKVVLAREVAVEAPSAHDPAAVFGALRELFPSCFCFCVGSPEGAFLGASPELLIRRRGASAAAVALAGSTRRSADPSVDDHLGEQLLRSEKDRVEHEIVARRIGRLLRPHSVWVEAEPEPGLIKVANIQHLATPIHAQLTEARSAVELAGILHPTPAVGGEPRDRALETIAELEEMDRGWYAGPVGWMDAAEDGEFCVALRSALLRDRTAHLYAGAGIVGESDPAAELAETEVKLGALLPLLAG
ncbi:MAG TPA: isochorismate synthase [Solirubrobacterales bacterium]|nr:isochorismate synthase [Solirubrobacterales bacterium]